MKLFTLALLWVFITGFTYRIDEGYKANISGPFIASISGDIFPAQEGHLNASLVNQPPSLDGRRPARKVISVFMNGTPYLNAQGRPFNQNILLEINFDEAMPEEPSVYAVSMQYRSVVYSVIKQNGDIKISGFAWEPDHKHFHLSVEFNCLMRSWGYPVDNQPDVTLQGYVKDVTIACPYVGVASALRSF
ncbi:MAG: hypothetical protein JWO06_2078 [Bacteroidota bacterium]|nr:hypothetical protein [Bacteroidota bacterium]